MADPVWPGKTCDDVIFFNQLLASTDITDYLKRCVGLKSLRAYNIRPAWIPTVMLQPKEMFDTSANNVVHVEFSYITWNEH
jgi:hypothetical protein